MAGSGLQSTSVRGDPPTTQIGGVLCLSLATRNTKAAPRFLGKALRGLNEWEQPEVLNTDKAPTHAAAIALLHDHPANTES